MEQLMKLKDVYIVWHGNKVRVVPKSDGVPCKDRCGEREGYYDPSDWKLSPEHFFLEQFTALTYSRFSPQQVQHEFEKIREYVELEDKAMEAMQSMPRPKRTQAA